MKFNWKCNFLMLALVALASTPAFTQIVVNTVPFDPTNPSAPTLLMPAPPSCWEPP